MTDKTQPEALRLANEFKLCNEYDSIPSITDIAKAEAELRRQHARIAELEAALFAYASEFEPNGDGDPDVGSIHANIRAMKAKLASIGAGAALSACTPPAGWKCVPEDATDAMVFAGCTVDNATHMKIDNSVLKAKVWHAMLAASPTPPAEQQAITPETGNSVSAQGAAITSESGAVYAELPELTSTEINDACWAFVEAMPHNLPGPIWNGLKPAVYAAICKFLQAAPKAAPGEWAEQDALGILNQLSDGPFGQSDVDDALDFMRLVDTARRDKAAPVKACVCGEPQAPGTVHRVDGPCYVAAPQQAAPKAAPGKRLTREQIREVFMANGFTVKEGQTDLKQYVYDAAHALLELVAAPKQEAQEPCPTCAALARTVMLDQVSFDRKPDCYGIRQITADEGVEEWEDIRTSPDVAREEANDMMATGRGEIYEVVPLWTTPQPAPAPLSDDVVKDAARLDWLALAGPTSICVVIDRPHDGEVEVATDDVTGYGKTLREAIDDARKQGANHD